MKKIKVILIILIIINIVTLVYLFSIDTVSMYTLKEYTDIMATKNDKPITNNQEEENNIEISNISILYNNYIGEIPIMEVTTRVQNLINKNLEKMYKDTVGMNNNELVNYLAINKEDIAMSTGITQIEDLASFIQKIQIYKDETIKCVKAEIVESSYINGNDYDTFRVKLTYNNEKTILFNVWLSNRDFISTPIVIIK